MSRLLLVAALSLPVCRTASAQSRPILDSFGDPVPEGAFVRLGSVRLRQAQSINCLAMSPDGKTVLSGSYTNKVHVWDVASGKLRAEWTVLPYSVQAIQFSRDGKVLALAGGDGSVRILDPVTGAEKRTLQDPMRSSGNSHIALSPDGKTLILSHRYDREIVVWNIDSGAIKHRITGLTTYYAPPIQFTPDSRQFVTLWTDNRLHLVDVSTGKSVRCLEPTRAASSTSTYSSRIGGLALSQDGKTLVFRASNDRFFTVVEVATAKVVRRFEKTGNSYYSSSSGAMTISPNGRFVYEASGDGAVRILGLTSGKMLRELSPASGSVNHMCTSADGKLVASAYGNVISVWDVPSGRELHPGQGHASSVYRLMFSLDGKHLYTAGSNSLRAWNLSTAREVERTKASSGGHGMFHMRLIEGGKALEWVGSDRHVYRWRIGSAGEPDRLNSPRNVQYHSTQGISADGKLLAGIGSQDRRLRLIDLVDSKPDRELITLAEPYSNNLVFSPDGRLLALATRDRSVALFDVATGLEVRRLMSDPSAGSHSYTSQVQFSPDSRSMLVYDGDFKLIETLTGSERIRFPRDPAGSPSAMALSENGRLVARGQNDGSVAVFDAWTGRELLRRDSGQGAIYSVAFSRDHRRLATGGANTTVLVWDLPSLGEPTRVPAMSDDSAWRELEESDAARGFRTMLHLMAGPETTMKLLRDRYRPRPAVDVKRIAKLIEDLDADSYAIREKAAEELEEIGPAAKEALQKASRSLSLEVKRKAEDLLRKLADEAGMSGPRLRAHRVVELLERLGTTPARETLRAMQKARLGPAVDGSIKTALQRLGEAS